MHQFYLQHALDLAVANVKAGGGPFAAVIVQQQTIIATGVNQVTQLLDPTAHAEIQAIRAACQTLNCFQLNNCILYSSCEPCPMCLGAVYWARLAKVYYANTSEQAAAVNFDDGFIYTELAKAPAQRKIPMIHLTLTNAAQAFDAWQACGDKVVY